MNRERIHRDFDDYLDCESSTMPTIALTELFQGGSLMSSLQMTKHAPAAITAAMLTPHCCARPDGVLVRGL